MINSFEEKYKFINENNLEPTGFALGYLEDKDLTEEGLATKVVQIAKRYEDNGCKYPENIMCQLRQRLGLGDEYDTSLDEEINNMGSDEVFENLLAWNGLPGWEYNIKKWINIIYGVNLNEK
ncbi:MAG: hypothetical protein RSC24_06260 [Clostridium sp.]